jgi:hypothetical protein
LVGLESVMEWNWGIIALLRGSDAIDSVVDWTLLIVLPSGNLTQLWKISTSTGESSHVNISAQFVITMSIYWRVSDLASQPILGLWYFGPQDRYGKLVSSSPIAREVGTTVSAGGSANCPWSWWLQAATIAARQQL